MCVSLRFFLPNGCSILSWPLDGDLGHIFTFVTILFVALGGLRKSACGFLPYILTGHFLYPGLCSPHWDIRQYMNTKILAIMLLRLQVGGTKKLTMLKNGICNIYLNVDATSCPFCCVLQALHSSETHPSQGSPYPAPTLSKFPTPPSGNQPQPLQVLGMAFLVQGLEGGWPWVPEEGLGQAWGLWAAPGCELLSQGLQKPRRAVEGGWDVPGQLATISLNDQGQFKAS